MAWKTLLIFLLLVVILVYFVKTLVKLKAQKRSRMECICVLILTIAVVCIMFPVSLYVWPFPISVKLEEVAQMTATEDISIPEERSWYCVYDIRYFGNASEESYCGLPNCQTNEEYPTMDFDRYTYLISFEREVLELSYYVWDNKGPGIIDFGTSTKWGTAELSEEISEGIIYIYRFPKMAIDNIAVTKYAYQEEQ